MVENPYIYWALSIGILTGYALGRFTVKRCHQWSRWFTDEGDRDIVYRVCTKCGKRESANE